MTQRFIVNTITHWNEPPRARHQVAKALARRYPVLFVAANKPGLPAFRKQSKGKNLVLLQPYFPLSYRIRHRIPIMNRLYQQWLYRRLIKQFPDSIAVNFDFSAYRIHRFFPRNIYYCNDDHVGLSKRVNPGWISGYHERCEEIMAKHANFCVGTSEFLVKKLKQKNQNSYEIRLGAPDSDELPPVNFQQTGESGKIHAGIVGYLSTIDVSLLNFLLSNNEMRITIVGPVRKQDLGKIGDHSNLLLAGILVGEKLYHAIGAFDVGLIPYYMKGTIDRTPNKLWQYLAVGKPVVITNIPGIRNWDFPDGFVYRANNPNEFMEQIRTAAEENSESLAQSRMDYARENSWAKRIDSFLSHCRKHCELISVTPR